MITKAKEYHVPVLLKESIDALHCVNGCFADMTFGGGGHSKEILNRLSKNSKLYAFDQDADAEKNIPYDNRFIFVRSNFRYLKNWMKYYGVKYIDGIVADLGVSSHHFDDETRGFSFRYDAPLDMRMNNRSGCTASDILNGYNEEKLASIFVLYGEIKEAKKLAKRIVAFRNIQEIKNTQHLLDAVWGEQEITPSIKKDAARLFQALRIEVNHELQALSEMLIATTHLLKPGGRLVVITYHSLEDRIVKNLMKSGNVDGKIKKDFFGNTESVFSRISKPITATQEEQQRNPRSRSAKLRVAIKA